MNLREKFFWNITVAISIIILLWNGWKIFKQHQISSNALNKYKYDNEEVGTDKELEAMVKNLEKSLKKRQDMKFRIAENPLELSKVISIYGISSKKGQKGIDCSTAWSNSDGSYTALCKYKSVRHKVAEGDSIGGGLVESVTNTRVIITKDGEIVEFYFGL